jgi:rhodanese-related sulfurtransferase
MHLINRSVAIQACFCLFLTLFAACNLSAQSEFRLSVADFEAKLKAGNVQLLDVRTSDEYNTGYIEGALQADWLNEKQFFERIAHLDTKKPVLVYCASGIRSQAASNALRKKGLTVFELGGGLNKWKREGKPLKAVAPARQLSQADFEQMIAGNDIFLVDVGAEWCPPCRKMEPVLAQLQKEAGPRFKLIRIDAGTHTELLKTLKVDALPHFFVYRNGKVTWQKQGIVPLEELKAATR